MNATIFPCRHGAVAVANKGPKAPEEGKAFRACAIDLASADEMSLPAVLREVEAAHATGGAGSEPSALLKDPARTGGSFAAWRKA